LRQQALSLVDQRTRLGQPCRPLLQSRALPLRAWAQGEKAFSLGFLF
jgi:hypothetical protein